MDEYLVNRVLTASPHQLHLMVVEACLRHMRAAEAALEDDAFDKAHTALDEARRHLSHLLGGLNPEADDEFMVNLRGLFKLAFRQLTLADIDHQTDHVRSAISVVASHRETWTLLIDELSGAEPVAAAAAPTGRLTISA